MQAIATAKAHGIDVLIDAVLNVGEFHCMSAMFVHSCPGQHKLGADRPEAFQAVQVEDTDRNKEAGPVQEIEV